ncbi:unnamed protein product [Moneuplotes crassus]|uniref:Uncharacterized protein n=1 Tax=Euplotes crassus TaxID=5936 RepID=A0AAD1Y3T0_EUPCR|nr:unnamed protein product [Moneuplotes crassus]
MNKVHGRANIRSNLDNTSEKEVDLLANHKPQCEIKAMNMNIRDFVMPVDKQEKKQRRETKRQNGSNSLMVEPDTTLSKTSIEIYFYNDLKKNCDDHESSVHLSNIDHDNNRLYPSRCFGCTIF